MNNDLSLKDIIRISESISNRCTTIEDLHKALKNFDFCKLKKDAINTVLSNHYNKSDIMFIGEAPGRNEDEKGVPFCGHSGRLIEKMFSTIGYHRNDILISNSVFWRPPENRTPTCDEIAICRPFVFRLIEIVKPKIIILAGSTAIQSIFGENKPISKIRGIIAQIKDKNNNDLNIFPIYHPAYVLRQSSKMDIMKEDFITIKSFVDNNK